MNTFSKTPATRHPLSFSPKGPRHDSTVKCTSYLLLKGVKLTHMDAMSRHILPPNNITVS